MSKHNYFLFFPTARCPSWQVELAFHSETAPHTFLAADAKEKKASKLGGSEMAFFSSPGLEANLWKLAIIIMEWAKPASHLSKHWAAHFWFTCCGCWEKANTGRMWLWLRVTQDSRSQTCQIISSFLSSHHQGSKSNHCWPERAPSSPPWRIVLDLLLVLFKCIGTFPQSVSQGWPGLCWWELNALRTVTTSHKCQGGKTPTCGVYHDYAFSEEKLV